MEETSRNQETAQLGIGAVMLRDFLLTCRIEENGNGSGNFNHMANIYEITKGLNRSRSWYFKAARELENNDNKFWRAYGTDLCFYHAP